MRTLLILLLSCCPAVAQQTFRSVQTTKLSTAPTIRSTGNALYTFGDSRVSGACNVVTNYTSGGGMLAQYRWTERLATALGLSLTNGGLGGTSHGYFVSASALGRKTPVNVAGVTLPADWTGVAACLVGYNHISYMDTTPGFDSAFEAAQAAFIARALATGWISGTSGIDHHGNAWGVWTATGTSDTLSGYTDDAIFPRGAVGTDQRIRTTFDGTDTLLLSVTNHTALGVHFDFSAGGGVVDVYTNGTFAGRINSNYDGRTALGNVSFPGVLWLDNLPASCSLLITNVSGTTLLTGVSVTQSIPLDRERLVIMANEPRRSQGPPYAPESRISAATYRAVARFSRRWPVTMADIFSGWNEHQNQQAGDEAHWTPWGHDAALASFLRPTTPPPVSDLGAAATGGAVSWVARANGTNLVDVTSLVSPRFVVGPVSGQLNPARIGVSSDSAYRAEMGFYQGDKADATGLNWAWSQNSGSSPSMRLLKYVGGAAAGVGIEFNYSSLGVTLPNAVTVSGALTANAGVTIAAATPTLTLSPTGTGASSQILWQSNSITAFRTEMSDRETLRVVGTDSGGASLVTAQRWHRLGPVSFPAAVTNEQTSTLVGDVFIGNSGAGTDSQIYTTAPAGLSNQIIWRTGSNATATNRMSLELADYSTWRMVAKDSAGATLFAPYTVNLTSGTVVESGSGWTNNHTSATLTSGVLNLGGISITTGSAAPSAAAPDGSVYLRTSGPPFFYVRESGAWVSK